MCRTRLPLAHRVPSATQSSREKFGYTRSDIYQTDIERTDHCTALSLTYIHAQVRLPAARYSLRVFLRLAHFKAGVDWLFQGFNSWVLRPYAGSFAAFPGCLVSTGGYLQLQKCSTLCEMSCHASVGPPKASQACEQPASPCVKVSQVKPEAHACKTQLHYASTE